MKRERGGRDGDEDDDDLFRELFGSDDEDGGQPSGRQAPPNATQDAADLARRRKALKSRRAKTVQSKKRLKCDCYEDRALGRVHYQMGVVESALVKLRDALPPLSDKTAKPDADRIRECRRGLKACEKMLKEMAPAVADVRRISERGAARAGEMARLLACVTAKRTDMNVVTRDGAPLQITHHHAFRSLDYRPPPKKRNNN